MITIPNMHYSLQVLGWLGLGLLSLLSGHIQAKWLRKATDAIKGYSPRWPWSHS
jgi:hypothetical protein